MNRRQFTQNVAILISMMVADGYEPVGNHLFRSDQEQKALFDQGYSKCDGITKRSKHQDGKAMDIVFYVDGMFDWGCEKTREAHEHYHNIWVTMGGQPMISWDACHYEM